MPTPLRRLGLTRLKFWTCKDLSLDLACGKCGDTDMQTPWNLEPDLKPLLDSERNSGSLTPHRIAIMNLARRGVDNADTTMRVSANLQPRSHLAGVWRGERQLLANPPFNNSDSFRRCN